MGHATSRSRSFLRVSLREADDLGNELFVLRGQQEPDGNQGRAASESSLPTCADVDDHDEHAAAVLFRPAPLWQRWLPVALARTLVAATSAAAPPPTEGEEAHMPVHLTGVRVLCDESISSGFNLPSLRRLAATAANGIAGDASGGGSGSDGGGFVDGTPWADSWRVSCVEEHCRPARLGMWGWIFRLKHSVLAVHLRRREAGVATSGTGGIPVPPQQDLLYIDKNADIGVGWRRAGIGESFNEAPREGHSYPVDLSVHDFWAAVAATKAFGEAQERSNCQHFVQEALAELAARRHFQAAETTTGFGFTLRNQWVADILRSWGYLDEDFKAPPGQEGGRQAWRLLMSWDCKAGAMQFFTPWVERFVLRPAAIDGQT